jgi:hypothetical protein
MQKQVIEHKVFRALFFVFPFAIILLSTPIQAQEITYDNRVFDSNLQSVQLFRLGWSNSYPIIELGDSDQKLQLSFDDFTGEARDFSYSFIHCDANWKRSDLNILEYQMGPDYDLLRDMVFSRGSRTRFVHYDLFFPNNQIELTLSGNYIIQVTDNETGQVVLTRQFYVVEQEVTIVPKIKRATQARYRFTHHEVDFDVMSGGYTITNPYEDFQVHLFQNQRMDNAIKDLKPMFIKQHQLVYDYDDKNLFPGGNEFRFFDIRDLTYRALGTEFTEIVRDTFRVYLTPDELRGTRQYIDYGDINGRYLIHQTDPRDIALIDAEYVWVHFRLPYPSPLVGAKLYLLGEFTQWRFSPDFELTYHPGYKGYVGKALVKQGYYNYHYAIVNNNTGVGDITLIEGNHFETENEYLFLAYHRKIGEIYDRLIGFQIAKYQDK